jgi:hypothetical protein
MDVAIGYRQKLLGLDSTDEVNRIELVRLFAIAKRNDEALANLGAIIGDRTTSRQMRWQAVLLAPEIIRENSDDWTKLKAEIHSANPSDSEMASAIDAIQKLSTGQPGDAARLLSAMETTNPNPYVLVLLATAEEKAGQNWNASQHYIHALTAGDAAATEAAFKWSLPGVVEQLARLYIRSGHTEAALRLAERIDGLKQVEMKKDTADESGASQDNVGSLAGSTPGETPAVPGNGGQAKKPAYRSLSALAESRKKSGRLELLDLLSNAAEKIGEFSKATEFARARVELLPTTTERRVAKERIERLIRLEDERIKKHSRAFTIDQNFVTKN